MEYKCRALITKALKTMRRSSFSTFLSSVTLAFMFSGCSGGGGGVSGLSDSGGPTSTIGGVAITALYPTSSGPSWVAVKDNTGKYYVAGNMVTVSGTCGKGVANVAVSVNGAQDPNTPTVVCDTNGNFTWSKTTVANPSIPNEGNYTLGFTGQDNAGNTTASVTANVRVDNAAPIMCISSVQYTDQAGLETCTTTLLSGTCAYPASVPPTTLSYSCKPTSSAPSVTISGTLYTSDGSADIYRITGAGQDTANSPTSLTFNASAKTWSITSPLAAGSSPVFVFTVYDEAGNTSSTQLQIQSASPFNGSRIAANRKNHDGSTQDGTSAHPFLADILDFNTGAVAEVSSSALPGIVYDNFRTGYTNFSFTTNFNGIVNQERSGQ